MFWGNSFKWLPRRGEALLMASAPTPLAQSTINGGSDCFPVYVIDGSGKNIESLRIAYHKFLEGVTEFIKVTVFGVIAVGILCAFGIDGAHEIMEDRRSCYSSVA